MEVGPGMRFHLHLDCFESSSVEFVFAFFRACSGFWATFASSSLEKLFCIVMSRKMFLQSCKSSSKSGDFAFFAWTAPNSGLIRSSQSFFCIHATPFKNTTPRLRPQNTGFVVIWKRRGYTVSRDYEITRECPFTVGWLQIVGFCGLRAASSPVISSLDRSRPSLSRVSFEFSFLEHVGD